MKAGKADEAEPLKAQKVALETQLEADAKFLKVKKKKKNEKERKEKTLIFFFFF